MAGLENMLTDTLNALKNVKNALENGADQSDAGTDTTGNGSDDTQTESEEEADPGIVVNVNGEDVKLTGKNGYIYVDVFEFIDFDLSKPQGHAVVTKLNGRSAVFNEMIKTGDKIEIYWEK